MKKNISVSLVLLMLLLMGTACKKDAEQTINSGIYGEWNLTRHSAGLAGIESFAKDDITWTFNSNGTVDVLINTALGANSYVPIKTSSSHTYLVNGTEITINGRTYDFYFEGRDLILSDHPEVDGTLTKFERD